MNSKLKQRLISPKFMTKFAVMYLIGSALMLGCAPLALLYGSFDDRLIYGFLLTLLPLSWFHTFFNKDYANSYFLKLTNRLHVIIFALGVLYLGFTLLNRFL